MDVDSDVRNVSTQPSDDADCKPMEAEDSNVCKLPMIPWL